MSYYANNHTELFGGCQEDREEPTVAWHILNVSRKLANKAENLKQSLYDFYKVEKCEHCNELVRRVDYNYEQHMCKLCIEENWGK